MSQTEKLVEEGYVPDRTPFVVWFTALALGPIVMTIALAASRSYGARLSLATLATLAVVSCTSQALVMDQVFDRSVTGWAVAATAYLPLAAAAWWAAVTGIHSARTQR